jgi:amidase
MTVGDAFEDCVSFINETNATYRYLTYLDECALSSYERSRVSSEKFEQRSLLDGVAVLVKDNIDSADMPTTAGSLVLAQLPHPRSDAPVLAALRAAGCIVMGKANLSEWSNFRGSNSISGWSAVGGQCANALNPRRSPGGSSSGSAVAVSLGVVRIAVGTETDGSLMCPASFNGVAALKPTHGVLSTKGVVPIAKSQDTVGPIARSILDLSRAFITMAGLKNPFSLFDSIKEFTKETFETTKTPRIGVASSSLFGYHTRTDEIVNATLKELSKRLDVVYDCDSGERNALRVSSELEYEVLLNEFAYGIEEYLASRSLPSHVTGRALNWLVNENRALKDKEMGLFGQELFESALERPSDLSSLRYLQALATNRSNAIRRLDRAFSTYSLDVIAAPTISPAPLIDERLGDFVLGAGYSIAAVSGYPSLTMPVGDIDGLPVGLLLIGKPKQEIELLSIAAVIEDFIAFEHNGS